MQLRGHYLVAVHLVDSFTAAASVGIVQNVVVNQAATRSRAISFLKGAGVMEDVIASPFKTFEKASRAFISQAASV